jgi:hypothetical protein
MKSVDVREDLKRVITREEADERVAWHKKWCEELDKANAESPLPDDIMDYVKGRKFFRQTVPSVPQEERPRRELA